MKKRILSMLLVIVMVLSLVPVSALAAGNWKIVSNKAGDVLYVGGDSMTLSLEDGEGNPITAGIGWWDLPGGLDPVSKSDKLTFTASKQGSYTITAEYGGEQKTKTVTAYQTPESLTIVKKDGTPAPNKMEAGEDLELSFSYMSVAEIDPSLVTTQWSVTGDAGVLNVDANGKVTTLGGYGTATVQLTMNGKTTTHSITVEAPAPGEIAVTEANNATHVYVGKTLTLTAMIGINPANNATYTVEGDADAVKVTQSSNIFTVEGKNPGTATIQFAMTGSAGRKYAGSYTVTVDALNALEIRAESSNFYAGKTVQLKAYDASGNEVEGAVWWCNDKNIAVADRYTGLLQCVAEGTASVVAKKDGYIDANLPIAVAKDHIRILDAADSTNTELTEATIYAGDSLQLKAVDCEGNALTAAWDSDAPGNASIDPASGKLTGVAATAEGSFVTIKVTAAGYDDVLLQVKVLSKASFFKLRLDDRDRETKLAVNETRGLMAFAVSGGDPLEGVEWEITSGAEYAELVGENRDQLKGLKDGKVELTAKKAGFEPKTVKITVETVALESVEIPGFPKEMNEGQQIALDTILDGAVFTPAYATDKTVVFTSGDTDVLDIVDGKLVAKKYGIATITGTYSAKDGTKELKFAVEVRAAKHIETDPNMPAELVCGESMDLSAVLKDTDGKVLDAQIQWRLKDKVIKNLVELTGNKLTAFPQSGYDFYVELEAYVDDTQVEALPVTIHVIPRTGSIALMNGTKNVTDKTSLLNLNDAAAVAAGITIQAKFTPEDSRKVVSWQVLDPNGVCRHTAGDDSLTVYPVTTLKTGSVTIIATASDGTGATAKTTVEFARLAQDVKILNAPEKLRGGETLKLRTSLEEDKTLTDRNVKWTIVDGSDVASIAEDGTLTTKPVTKQKKVTVKAEVKADEKAVSDTKTITLCPSVTGIKITQNDIKDGTIDFTVGKIQFTAAATPDEAIQKFVWSTSNKDVVDIDAETGEATLKDAGKVRITCTAADGSNVKAYLDFEVLKKAGDVVIEGVDELITGKSAVMKATVYTDSAKTLKAGNQKVTWSVTSANGSATSHASIDSKGRLVANTVYCSVQVIVQAKSADDDTVIGTHIVTILPKQDKTFVAMKDDGSGAKYLGSTLRMNKGDEVFIFGRWYTRETDTVEMEYDCTYFSSKSSVATVSSDGLLKAKDFGSATITVRAKDQKTGDIYTAKFTVKVTSMVGYVEITTPKTTVVRSGSYMNLSATAWTNSTKKVKSSEQGFNWKVYQLNDDGEYVTATAAYATTGGRIYANTVTENTTVWVVASSREDSSYVDYVELTIQPKNKRTPVVFYNDGGKDRTDNWRVELSYKGAAVDNVGAKIYDTVHGKYIYRTPSLVTWSTSNSKIIGVDYKGAGNQLVFGGSTGRVKITAKIKYGSSYYTASMYLNVVQSVEEIEISSKSSSNEMYSGGSLLMTAKVTKPSNPTNKGVEWSLIGSGDNAVASINASTGLLRAKSGLSTQQTVTVRAKALDGSGVTEEVDVIIYPLATKVEISEGTSIPLKLDDTEILHATVYPDDTLLGAKQDVKWTSNRSTVVTVDANGKITAKRTGTATIKATAADGSGKYATITVTVTK